MLGSDDICLKSRKGFHAETTRPKKQVCEGDTIMSSSNRSNQPVVPSAREALDKFKMEADQDLGVPTSY